ncbi:MAG TPA: tetratricopeptide repeat protein [Polyangiaceae bacterium]|nr:tetratricopeptide repeat protein [Polyangiaceae bacterium]
MSVLFTLCMLLGAPSRAAAEARDEARLHFNRALQLVDGQRFEEAAVEFEQAYELSPNPAVLYNLGQAYAAARHPTQAIAAFRGYLAAASGPEDPRRKQALRELPRLEALVGVLVLLARPSQVEVHVDGRRVQTTGPLQLDPGRHQIVVSAPGYRAEEREVVAMSGTRETWNLELSPIADQPALEAAQAPRLARAQPHSPPRARNVPLTRHPPTPEDDAVLRRSKQRVWWTATAAGAGLLLGGITAGLVVDNGARYGRWREQQASLDQRWRSAPADSELIEHQSRNDERAERIKLQDEVAVGLGVAGAACFVGAVMIWMLSDSPPAVSAGLGGSPQAQTGTLSVAW